MSPFKHNIRNLGKAFRKANTHERKLAIVRAAYANQTCNLNSKNAAALAFLTPMMMGDMEAAGVQPVSM